MLGNVPFISTISSEMGPCINGGVLCGFFLLYAGRSQMYLFHFIIGWDMERVHHVNKVGGVIKQKKYICRKKPRCYAAASQDLSVRPRERPFPRKRSNIKILSLSFPHFVYASASHSNAIFM